MITFCVRLLFISKSSAGTSAPSACVTRLRLAFPALADKCISPNMRELPQQQIKGLCL